MIKCTLQFYWKSTLPKSLFSNNIIVQQIKSSQVKHWFLMRGENQSTQEKTSQGRTENQQTQSTCDAACGN